MSLGKAHKHEPLGPTSAIPDKLYFKIGEVAQLVGVHAHVLRYWQSEIPSIRPVMSSSNQRRYRFKDVELFREIRRLLYEERFTLAGAKRRLLSGETSGAGAAEAVGQGEALPSAARAATAAVAPAPSPRVATTGDGVVPLPAFKEAPRPTAPTPPSRADEEAVERVRRGLKDLIRLCGEEP